MSSVATAPEAKSQIALRIVAAAAAMGLLGDDLIRATPWGLNIGLWTVGLTVWLLVIACRRRIRLNGGGRWLLFPAILFAAAIAWRDSPTLVWLNILAVGVALGLAAVRSRAGRIRVAGATDYLISLGVAALGSGLGPLALVFSDIDRSQVSRSRWSPQVMAVGRGLAIGVPLVLIFGCLFAAADGVFEGLVSNLFAWDVASVLWHGVLFAFSGWFAGGFLRQALLSRDVPNPIRRCHRALSLGIVEMGIVLGLLDVLFLAFVLVPLRYLFGGAALVESSSGLTYAEYARRGFFELVAVAALVLPLLLLGEWDAARLPPVGWSTRCAAVCHHGVGAGTDALVSAGVRADGAAVLYHGLHGMACSGVRVAAPDRPPGPSKQVCVRRTGSGVRVPRAPERDQSRRVHSAHEPRARRRRETL
ncbi:MAG: DUF4173 domain-containing protein [Chloroflexota bacterium]|nr:DUF4173 domain-containing protein [Chloroflexota bacterium]